MTELEKLKTDLKKLSLPTIMQVFEEEAKRAAKLKISYTAYLSKLIEEEILAKTDRSINVKISKARFPVIKTLETFDFKFQPNINEALIKELAELGFIDKAENIILAGPPGVGKTHLAIAIGVKACQYRKRVLFTNTISLINELVAATVDKSISQKLLLLASLDILIIDELGYMPMTNEAYNLFFQLVSKMYEKKSIIITTNKPFQEWGEIFKDDVIASAILDRLLHHSHIFAINGASYRTKNKLTKKE